MFGQILGNPIHRHSPKVAVFRQRLNEVVAATNNFDLPDTWQRIHFTDPSGLIAVLNSLTLSYTAPAMNAAARYSDWNKNARWMTLRVDPYVNNPTQDEDYFDQGSLRLVRGGAWLLIHAAT